MARPAAAAALVAIAAASAFATVRLASRSEPAPQVSSPRFVSHDCYRDGRTRSACRVALRYLRALDLDRFAEACGQLARDTLEQAGGAPGCLRTLARSRGNRILYEIDEARSSVLGVSIAFRTQAADRKTPEIQQVMLVALERGAPRIVTVQPNPYPEPRPSG